MSVVDIKQDKVSRKKKPTVILRSDDRIVKFSANSLNESYLEKFNHDFNKESSFYTVGSVKDLAERIRSFNKNLNDTTIVYCHD